MKINSYDDALNFLFEKRNFNNKSLKNFKELVIDNNLYPTYPLVLVTGTNGKGEVIQYTKNILKNICHVGAFISPHIESFNERITINDRYISNSEVMYYTSEIQKLNDIYLNKYNNQLSFFEMTLLMALMFFKDREIKIGLFEVGIGGKNDSTNILDPILSVIVNVGLDHQNILGNTKEEILNEKLGITRQNRTLITSELSLASNIYEYSKKNNITLINVNDKFKYINNQEFMYDDIKYNKNIKGIGASLDAAISIEIAKFFYKDCPFDFIDYSLKYTYMPSRIEIISNNPLVIIDGAHNIDAINNLINYINDIKDNKKINILFGILNDKLYKEIINLLDSVASKYYLFDFDDLRAVKKEDIAKIMKKEYLLFDNIDELFSNINISSNEIYLFCGSFHLSFLVKQKFIDKLKK